MSSLAKSVLIILNVFAFVRISYQDVSHLYVHPGQFSYFQQQQQPHHQNQYQYHPIAFQTGLPALYAPPPASIGGGLVGPAEVVTPAPVAPVSSTTELLLPEIVENRSVKDQRDHRNFIPLHKQYLPPAPPAFDERPNYETPQQG